MTDIDIKQNDTAGKLAEAMGYGSDFKEFAKKVTELTFETIDKKNQKIAPIIAKQIVKGIPVKIDEKAVKAAKDAAKQAAKESAKDAAKEATKSATKKEASKEDTKSEKPTNDTPAPADNQPKDDLDLQLNFPPMPKAKKPKEEVKEEAKEEDSSGISIPSPSAAPTDSGISIPRPNSRFMPGNSAFADNRASFDPQTGMRVVAGVDSFKRRTNQGGPGAPGGFQGGAGGRGGAQGGAGYKGNNSGGQGGNRDGNRGPNAGGPNAGGPNAGGLPTGPGVAGRGQRRGFKAGTAGAFGKGNKKSKKKETVKFTEYEMEGRTVRSESIIKGDGDQEIRLRAGSTLTDFAEKIGATPTSLVLELFKLGQMATATESIDEDTFVLLGAELGYTVKLLSESDVDKELLADFDLTNFDDENIEDDPDAITRAPVVSIMGHVDHGKTRLLDAIRNSDVTATESGGITQKIGAYQVSQELNGEQRKITFIDTPGHEAFTAMRVRGAKLTDISILVVAADDGVMPQTIEALNHANSAGIPVIVAVNKIDKEGADSSKVRGQLAEYGLLAEEYGGDTIFVDVSAKQGKGIHELLESVLLTADAALTLLANPNTEAKGIVIESKLDKGRGPVCAVLVQNGTIHKGDSIVVGASYGKVRAMYNDHMQEIEHAEPGMPVRILGLSSVPTAGDTLIVTADDKIARQIAQKRETAKRASELSKRRKKMSLEGFMGAVEEGKLNMLSIILKGDTSGSVEAVEDSLASIEIPESAGVGLRVIHRGVGAITQNDVNLASVDNAVIIGFNVKPELKIKQLADKEGIEVRYYDIIYHLTEEIEQSLVGMLAPLEEENPLGSAKIQEVFTSSKFGSIAGCKVEVGSVKRNAKARLIRDGVVVGDNLLIETLKRFKDDAAEVSEGFECGIGLTGFDSSIKSGEEFQIGDEIECFEIVEKAKKSLKD
ncbi:MAG: translation initiation factor IF-2 [Bifidobacteriaceae bacterium]|jgi:translation initiation factor IF-2|nr:translation initiation factor IF-2 [Bifidobacteriaceae bacterium]